MKTLVFFAFVTGVLFVLSACDGTAPTPPTGPAPQVTATLRPAGQEPMKKEEAARRFGGRAGYWQAQTITDQSGTRYTGCMVYTNPRGQGGASVELIVDEGFVGLFSGNTYSEGRKIPIDEGHVVTMCQKR